MHKHTHIPLSFDVVAGPSVVVVVGAAHKQRQLTDRENNTSCKDMHKSRQICIITLTK